MAITRCIQACIALLAASSMQAIIYGPYFIPIKNKYNVLVVTDEEPQKPGIKIKDITGQWIKPNFYTRLGRKFFIARFNEVTLPEDGSYSFKTATRPKQNSSIPKQGQDDQFDIMVYGDLRDKKVLKKTGDYIQNFIQNHRINPEITIMTGDLVKQGGVPEQWTDSFFKGLETVLKSKKVFQSAIGNHEFYGLDGSYKKIKPHAANMFYLPNRLKDVEPHEYISQLVQSFDIGKIRFISLPYVNNSIDKKIPDGTKKPRDIFKKELKKAHRDLNDNKIKYIVVFSHNPLVGVWSHHLPMFDDKDLKKQALYYQDLLDKYPVSAWFAGHNHLYDRSLYHTSNGHTIPMITIGVGTGLYSGTNAQDYYTRYGNRKVEHKKLIDKNTIGASAMTGFLYGKVHPEKISFNFYGAKLGNDEFKTHDTFDILPLK